METVDVDLCVVWKKVYFLTRYFLLQSIYFLNHKSYFFFFFLDRSNDKLGLTISIFYHMS